jgi:hypothetical protein
MKNYKKDEVTKLENQILELEEKMLNSHKHGDKKYNEFKNKQWELINELNKLRSSHKDN